MIVPTLLLAVLKPRVGLKPSRARVVAELASYTTRRAVAVWVDGRNTGVTIPDWREDPNWAIGFDAVREFSNQRRDLGGEFNQLYRGAMNGTWHHLFVKPKGGKLVILRSPEGGNNPQAVGIDARGNLLAVDDPSATELAEVTHAYLWKRSAWIDLGPADRARFERDGSIIGVFSVDSNGDSVPRIDWHYPRVREVRFRWKDGKRTESG